ncbi:hypothetical protein TKK_0002390 [Trichogramma kaykai]
MAIEGDAPVNFALFPTGSCFFCCPTLLDRDVTYNLYTRRNPTIPQIIQPGNMYSLRRSYFNASHPTVIYVHGYSERSPGASGGSIRNAYLFRNDYNIILVDWSKLAAMPWYVKAVQNTRLVGSHIAQMLRWLESQGAFSLRRVHLIGFSLGAEVAGFMGKSLFPQRIGRITGLDVAYPLYMNTGPEGHLTRADAEFVDIIHTDGGRLGFPIPLGHADFYPNGGIRRQPGCNIENIVSMGINMLLNRYITCSHNRAWRFYAESVTNPLGFPASRCPKWRPEMWRVNCPWRPEALMGFAASPQRIGMFYLRTNADTPFARNATGYF